LGTKLSSQQAWIENYEATRFFQNSKVEQVYQLG